MTDGGFSAEAERTRSRLAIVVAAVLFSTGGAAIKACTLSSWQVASFRSALAAVTLFLLLPDARARWTLRSVAVGSAYAAVMILFVLATKLTTAASTIFLQSTAPLYVLVLASRVLGEPIHGSDGVFMAALALGLGLCFAGTGPALETAPDQWNGNLLAALCGVAFGVALVGLRWLGRERDGRGGTIGAALVAANLFAFVATLPMALPVGPSAPVDWIVLAYLGVVQVGVGYACLAAGVRQVPALEASLLLLLEPALNPLWAWMMLGERPSAWTIAGGSVILLATAVRTWRGEH